MQLAEFEPIIPGQLKEQAYTIIKRAITSLQLQPGASIVESQLAQRLGISKTPIRMALVRLEQEGFIETRRASGTFVRRMTFDDVCEVFEVRRALEQCALERLCGPTGTGLMDALRAQLARARACSAEADAAAAFEAITQFHLLLVDLAGNSHLSATYRTLYDHVVRIGYVCGRIPGRNAASQQEHAAIVDALVARDAAAATGLMTAHLNGVLADYRLGAESNQLLEGTGHTDEQ
jgi:DNA-binding GntR family transcriptional regulator